MSGAMPAETIDAIDPLTTAGNEIAGKKMGLISTFCFDG